MSVKIITKREISIDNGREMLQHFRNLRAIAIAQPGYICGETLESLDRPDVYLVISNWRSVEDWEKWLLNEERQKVQIKIDLLLGGKTSYEMFHHGFNS
jgi:heme-degrading monooxygenase HmoA